MLPFKKVLLYKIFNSLPTSILKLQMNKLIFKSELRKYIVLHAVYAVEEFLSNDQDYV
jgi:hypothetical protein